jgi:hypothetical protein
MVQINAWFIEKRNPETGEYPDLPAEDEGGSKCILNPPLPTLEQLLADDTNAEGAKGGKDGKKDAGKAASGKPGGGKKGKGETLCTCI